MTFNQHSAYISLPAVTTHANELQDLRGYWTKFLAVGIFSSTVLTQQSALRSVHLLSNKRGDMYAVCKQPPGPTQPSTPSGWKMNTDQSTVTFCGWEVWQVWLNQVCGFNVRVAGETV